MKKYKTKKTFEYVYSYSPMKEKIGNYINVFIEFMPKHDLIFDAWECNVYDFPYYHFQYFKIIKYQSKIYEKI